MRPGEQVRVRELVAWGLDENSFRPDIEALPTRIDSSRRKASGGDASVLSDPTLLEVPKPVLDLLEQQRSRSDLRSEMKGLDWITGIVDLRRLLAFQRRLIFDDQFPYLTVPASDDWLALVALTFGPPVPVEYRTLLSNESELLLQSENPNLQIRTSIECNRHSFQLHGGSPFFEVAEFGGRWFLRDGYHRAYRLLRAGVVHSPAVIIRARTIAELGPVEPWFFSEEILFSTTPPYVTDFLDDGLTIDYTRPRLLKTLRITIEERVEPARHSLQENHNEHFNYTR
jgi:hypothetical protein